MDGNAPWGYFVPREVAESAKELPRMQRLDRPESWLAMQGFLVAFVWEMLQMPFFDMDHLSGWQQTKNCALASFGDAGIMVFSYLIARAFAGRQYWLHDSRPGPLATYLATGLTVTVAVELLAVRVPWGWEYSELMPKLAGIGLVTIAMWIVVPLVSLTLAARLTRPHST
ncbi:hypothetical protein ELI_14395 [Erythrobacter litoralis HTCC2594]|uniref:Uncharacterized protein n=2 Tax=Erythrobacter litoralis TaxID=39960 RepID=Q2N5S0_ERYLH|nr:hypothetical protein ELI_14395 [Erythrobacter litoralis HTCC2594]